MAKELKTSTLAFITVGIFFVLFLLIQRDSAFDVIVKDQLDNIVLEDETSIPKSVKIAQSLFTPDISQYNILLQATQPLQENNVAQLRVSFENPFKEVIKLAHVEVFKNGILVTNQKFNNLLLQPGQVHIYKTPEISLEGNMGQRNNIQIRFRIVFNSGDAQEIVYQYDYFSLTPCSTNAECSAPTNVCDLGNNAGFSTKANEYYCTKSCINNGNCYEGQVCKLGFCGY